MSTTIRRRRSIKRARPAGKALQGFPVKPSAISALSLDALILKSQNQDLPQPEAELAPSESVIDILWEAVKDTYNHIWKETDLLSYLAYNATFKVAKDWPPQYGWVLDLAALLSAARGFERITNRADIVLKPQRRY